MNLLFTGPPARRRLRVVGIVQGVGFRPFVARLAAELALSGFVRNTSVAVVIEVQGAADAVEAFERRLQTEGPRAATIEHVEATQLPADPSPGPFQIAESQTVAEAAASGVPPDLAMCADCARELADPNDRRYRYPFLNCTVCGPRYTIVTGLPYDRDQTSLRDFVLCADCRREYEDPPNRRYHAQPVACPACGPQLQESLDEILAALRGGQIAAIRGVGGFHLACSALDADAIATLRQRKARGDQPFALMARDLEAARRFVDIDEQAAQLLTSPAAPIVLLPKAGPLGDLLAPGNGYLGVMLPYSPLHRLLFDDALPALVMTSGNRHGEPIVTSNREARERLGELADGFLTHNREIAAPCDDSVVRLYRGRPLAIRRGRGYAPLQLRLPVQLQAPALAMGADLKAAFALAEAERVWMSPHIGDMENLETIEAFERTYAHLKRLYRIAPAWIAHDAHPGYLSTAWALRQGLPVRAVQHHRAHVASVLAEYGIAAEVETAAAIFDGTGYGDDGAIWGGELFRGPAARLERVRHLPYVMLPGGDASAKRPALCALAHLAAAGLALEDTAPWRSLSAAEQQLTARQLERRLNCHASSSMGRLFDAAASLLDIRHRAAYEAQAAIEMEAIAAAHPRNERYAAAPWRVADLLQELLADAHSPRPARARRFHGSIAWWTASSLLAQGLGLAVLSGGVFQNVLLLEETSALLEAQGIRALAPRYLPPNDGGLALGQLYLASLAQ